MRKLTYEEKIRIGTYLNQGLSYRAIAREMGRFNSTIRLFIHSRLFRERYSLVLLRGEKCKQRGYTGSDYTCGLCGAKLEFDTDGNGQLVESCSSRLH